MKGIRRFDSSITLRCKTLSIIKGIVLYLVLVKALTRYILPYLDLATTVNKDAIYGTIIGLIIAFVISGFIGYKIKKWKKRK